MGSRLRAKAIGIRIENENSILSYSYRHGLPFRESFPTLNDAKVFKTTIECLYVSLSPFLANLKGSLALEFLFCR